MKRSKLSATIYLLLVFLSGAVVGAFAYRLYTLNPVNAARKTQASPEEVRRRFVKEMQTRLKLSPAQVSQLEQIMDQTRQRFREFQERTKPQLDAIQAERKALQEQHAQQVSAMLSDSQKVEYAKIRAERAARRKLEEQQRQGR